MEMKTSSLIVLALILSIITGVLLKISEVGQQHFVPQINSYADCVAAGNPTLETYPSQCKTPDGHTFVNPDEQPAAQAPTSTQTQPQSQQYVQNGCMVAGCSGEMCSDATDAGNLVSNCIYMPQFACYKTARCEKQADGKCGWSMTADLSACIEAAPRPEAQPSAQ
jgi:hypothetical protein